MCDWRKIYCGKNNMTNANSRPLHIDVLATGRDSQYEAAEAGFSSICVPNSSTVLSNCLDYSCLDIKRTYPSHNVLFDDSSHAAHPLTTVAS
jgi:hypothetical protein